MLGTLRRIAQFWRPHRWLGLGLALSMLLQVVFTVVLAICVKWIVDGVVEGTAGRSAVPIVIALAVALVVSAGAAVVGGRLGARAAANILADVRLAMFDRLQRLSLGFYATTNEGNLLARFSSDIAQLSDGVIKRPLDGLRSVVSVLFYVPVMIVLDARLAVPALVATPIAVYLVNRFAPDADVALDDEKRRIAGVLDRVAENVQSQRVIRAFGLRTQSHARFRASIDALHAASTAAEFRVAMLSVLSKYSIAFVQLSIVAAGALMAFAGSIEAGTFAAFVALLTEFTWEMTVVGSDVLPQIRKAGSGIRRVDEILDAGPIVERPHDAVAPPQLQRSLRFEKVDFAYNAGDQLQLDRLDAEIPAGLNVAVVGRNGSGKSTMLNLLLGFYPPQSGIVWIDGVDLASVDLDEWRSQCGVVFQDTYLFNWSLRDNVVVGQHGLDDADVMRAVEAVGLGGLLERLPDGLDTVLGPSGRQISGGERQRIGLARAIVRRPRLLLLDEVTAALDPATELEIRRAIERLSEGRTVISVTHRLRAAEDADLVIAMDGGRVVESGPLRTLLDRGGITSEMWSKQQGFTISRDGGDAAISPSRLGSMALFNHFNETQLADLAKRFSPRLYDVDDVVVRQGAPAERFYIIARGVVEVIVDDDHSPQVIAHLEDGDFFGEMALLDRAPRNATVKAVTPTTMLSLERRQFESLLNDWPEAAKMIETVAASRAEQNRLGLGDR